ncbi:MAG TPA: hypothetical protein VFV78_04450 [Vicinamibacterales bacterium]|nr:hypothetical protein [Vicinamibacterales bacterium]
MTSRSRLLRIAMVVGALFVAASSWTPATAQQADAKPAQPPQPPSLPTVPVRVDVTLTRYQGDKKVSSLPFSLYASAGRQMQGQVRMRMGIDVPIGMTTTTETRTTPGSNGNPGVTNATGNSSTRPEYRSIGTDIDTYVLRTDETHYSVYVSISDSSIYTADGDAKSLKPADAAAFRTFSTSNTVILRDGQTLPFGTGTDKVSGEVIKIEVTLSVIK